MNLKYFSIEIAIFALLVSGSSGFYKSSRLPAIFNALRRNSNYRDVQFLEWGELPGARGTIDHRYPDYIVDPLVDCPTNGSFPHPRNCSWFYRCQFPNYSNDLHILAPYYIRTYYECAPGTVFDDAMDICVAGNEEDNCPSTGDPFDVCSTRVCTPPTPTCFSNTLCSGKMYDLCEPTIIPDSPSCAHCEFQLCPAANIYSSEQDLCYPSDVSMDAFACARDMMYPPQDCECTSDFGECQTYEACTSFPVGNHISLDGDYMLCNKPQYDCGGCGAYDICPEGMYLFISSESPVCIRSPDSDELKCDSKEPGIPKCTPSDPFYFDNESSGKNDCRNRTKCENGKEVFESMDCQQYYECDFNLLNQRISASMMACTVGEVFSLEQKICTSASGDEYKVKDCAEKKSDKDQSVSITTTVQHSYNCNSSHPFPMDDHVKNSKCKRKNICDENGRILKTGRICESYVECTFDSKNPLKDVICGEGEIFSLKYTDCVKFPYELCGDAKEDEFF